MSIEDFLNIISNDPSYLLGYFSLIPLLAAFLGWLYGRRYSTELMALPIVVRTRWHYLFSILVYAVYIPGSCSATLILYGLFFSQTNLLKVNALVYFMPLVSMVFTLSFIRQRVAFNQLPGFDRLWGLIVTLALSFIVILFLFKMRILIGFFTSMINLVLFWIVLFFIFKFSAGKIFRS